MDWSTQKYYSINCTIRQSFSQGTGMHTNAHIHTVAALTNGILRFWNEWYVIECVLQ